MLLMAKDGCIARLEHAVNEAESEHYAGLYQWNFCTENDRFIIWRPGVRLDVSAELAGLGEMTVLVNGKRIDVTIRRGAQPTGLNR